VQQAKHSGNFRHLQAALNAVKQAQSVFDRAVKDSDSKDNTESLHVPPSSVVNETQVIEKFGKQLRQVANERDTCHNSLCFMWTTKA